MKNQHVIPIDGKWVVKGAGNQRATKVAVTQQQALSRARAIARRQGTDVIIHGHNGSIPHKDTYACLSTHSLVAREDLGKSGPNPEQKS